MRQTANEGWIQSCPVAFLFTKYNRIVCSRRSCLWGECVLSLNWDGRLAFPFIWCCQVPNSADLIKPLFPFPHGSAGEFSVLVSKDWRTGFWKMICGSYLQNFAKNASISHYNCGLVLINTPGDHISCYCPLQQLVRSGIIWSASERRYVLKDRHTFWTRQLFILHLNFSGCITVCKS